MKPSAFRYERAASVDDAVALLAEHGDEASLLAGGQSLVPLMHLRLARPTVLIDINGITPLDHVTAEGPQLRVGALTRHATLERARHLDAPFDVLPAAAQHIAHAPIRNLGTFGGSIAHADPLSEWCAVALALDAEVELASSRGTRTVPFGDFLIGPYFTTREPDEMVTSIRLGGQVHAAAFAEQSRRPGDYAVVSVAVTISGSAQHCDSARIVVSGAESHPRRVADAERVLETSQPTQQALREAAAAAARCVEPVDDEIASARHRRRLTEFLTWHALEEALT